MPTTPRGRVRVATPTLRSAHTRAIESARVRVACTCTCVVYHLDLGRVCLESCSCVPIIFVRAHKIKPLTGCRGPVGRVRACASPSGARRSARRSLGVRHGGEVRRDPRICRGGRAPVSALTPTVGRRRTGPSTSWTTPPRRTTGSGSSASRGRCVHRCRSHCARRGGRR